MMNARRWVVFKLCGRRYALPTADVHGMVLANAGLAQNQDGSHSVEHRGRAVSCVNSERQESSPESASAVALVVGHDDGERALLADEVEQVITLGAEEIRELPDFLFPDAAPRPQGVAMVSDQMVVLLDASSVTQLEFL